MAGLKQLNLRTLGEVTTARGDAAEFLMAFNSSSTLAEAWASPLAMCCSRFGATCSCLHLECSYCFFVSRIGLLCVSKLWIIEQVKMPLDS